MNCNLFVSNLPFNYTDLELTELFRQYGLLHDAHVAHDKDTGLSRGFGFVTYCVPESAVTAMQMLNNHKLRGRRIRVDYAHSKQKGA